MNKLVVVTFATNSKDSPFRDYSEKNALLKDFVTKMGIEFLSFNPTQVLNSEFYSYQNKYFSLKKGAGFWHWKPVVILEALKSYPTHTILYVDVDVDIRMLDESKLILKSENHPIFAFQTLSNIKSWTSMRCIEILDPNLTCTGAPLYVAGILLIQSKSELVREFLFSWIEAMDNRDALLDSKYKLFSNHRHDQSIFSILASKRPDIVGNLGPGFWGHGIECEPIDIDDVWIGTSLSKYGSEESRIRLSDKLRFWGSNLRNLFDIWYYYVVH